MDILYYEDFPIKNSDILFSNIVRLMDMAQVIRGTHIIIEDILSIRDDYGYNLEDEDEEDEVKDPVNEDAVVEYLYDSVGFEDRYFVEVILEHAQNKGLIDYTEEEGFIVTKKGSKHLKNWEEFDSKIINKLPIQWIKCPRCDYELYDYNFSNYWRSKEK